MANFFTLDDLAPTGKRVLLRVDVNVPMKDGAVSDDTRIKAVAPTIKELARKGAKVILLAHFGRPKGKVVKDMSLAPIAPAIAKVIGKNVGFVADTIGDKATKAVAALKNGDILLLENTRFSPGEESNDQSFTGALAKLGDIYVNDAFSAAHRAHASTEGLAQILPAYAGRGMEKELRALNEALENPERPLVAVVGGAKISSKLELLDNLTSIADSLIIGGGMANTLLAAQGIRVGKSLCEHELLDTARDILAGAEKKGCQIILPVDAVVAKKFAANVEHQTVDLSDVADDDMILDVGVGSLAVMSDAVIGARTLVWNGPLGAFEIPPFDRGTVGLAKIAADQTRSNGLVTVAGGGDTVAALNHAKVAKHFSYISTAGGAFLEWLEGKELPGVKVLQKQEQD